MVRIEDRLVLVDLDASACFRRSPGRRRSLAALKYSSGWVDRSQATLQIRFLRCKRGARSRGDRAETEKPLLRGFCNPPQRAYMHESYLFTCVCVLIVGRYLAPELIYYSQADDVVCVRSPSDPRFVALSDSADAARAAAPPRVEAAAAQDMWSLGAVMYQLATGAPLLLCDTDGNCDAAGLRALASWPDDLKRDRLGAVTDRLARHLLSQLLCRDPAARPSARAVLAHPFLSGRPATRLPGDAAEFDVFLSYRVSADGALARVLYDRLTRDCGLRVWFDERCLEAGRPWEEGFCRGLVKSRVFVPVLSRGAIRGFEALTACSPRDNVLLEWRLALELVERGLVERVAPLLLGDADAAGRHGWYTFGGPDPSHPTAAPAVTVASVEAALEDRLDSEGLGLPMADDMTVADVVAGVCRYQGIFLEGTPEELERGLGTALAPILRFLRPAPTPPSPPTIAAPRQRRASG